MGAPPSEAGRVQETVAALGPGTATIDVGRSAMRAGVAGTAEAGRLMPSLLRAVTVTA